ncbi:tyrosine-type recombinase/integrase [Clostridium sp.]|uniref:tyrosine-type recombinase/integrase n=1 Tax=Clostridium sp. TaxID=1506 RepID=UPI001D9CA967|nr:tyrosine-type recombinase/integrase [Clostridium sp.]MBS5307805.1 tyrosine-type recombinase/integrase [Clostridium sp.]
MGKVQRVKYFTKERIAKINPDNIKKYEKYLRSNIIKNKDVEDTTFKVYKNNFNQFLVYLSEQWDNIDLYSEEFMDDAVDIMEGFMGFCQDTLLNNKKAINNKLSAISSFYHWSVKRKLIKYHPFDKQLDRMKGANDEHIINSYFLTQEQVDMIKEELAKEDGDYDIQDKILFNLAIDSANRVGALSKLTLSTMDLDECIFSDIREKRGYKVEVVFEEETRDMIEEWLNYRKDNLDKLEVDNLFIVKWNGEYRPMSKVSLQNRIRKIGNIVGIEDFHAHCTRKTKANLVSEMTGDITLASELLNHKSVETTRSSYIKKKSKTETRNKIRELMKKNSN